MMTMRCMYAAALAAVIAGGAPGTGNAAAVTAEFAFNDGNAALQISSGNGRVNLLSPTLSGTLEDYAFWVDADSFAFSSPRALRLRLDLRRDDPGGVLYETSLATIEYTQSDFNGLDSRMIANGDTFLKTIWDLSDMDLDVTAGEDLAVRFTTNPAIGLLVNDSRIAGAVPQPAEQNLALGNFATTQQTANQSLIYQLTVADNAVAAVPLPAALPMMLTGIAGLFGLSMRRRRKIDVA